ncbi:MAG: hypothetical protein OXD54_16320 [Candidatus Poribacteria bacterium]|nr:hypothetical protein [Candidatus Poribacteria bacterium]
MIQLAQCPRCLRKVYPGTRNGKKYAFDYFVTVDGDILSGNPHSETCPWGFMRDPLANGPMMIKDYADVLDEIQTIWKLGCVELEPRPPINWNEVDIYQQPPPLRHLNPITCQLIKQGGPYPKGNRNKLNTYFTGTVVSKAKKKKVIAILVERELFDKIHDFVYNYRSGNREGKPLKQVVVAGYYLIMNSTVPSEQKREIHDYGF